MAEAVKTSRGAVAVNKKQVNWRIRIDLLALAQSEATEKHIKSTPALIEHILQLRYYPEQPKKSPR